MQKKLQKLYDCLPIRNWLLVYNKFDIKWIFHIYSVINLTLDLYSEC